MNPAFVFRRVQAAESNIYSLCNWVGSIGAGQGGNTAALALSADVSSGFATFATSLAAAAAYQAKGSYPLSADVSSFYALKTSLPSVAGFSNSSDVSSFYALKTSLPSVAGFANSSDVAGAYQAKGSYALSADVSSFYALKTSLPSVAGLANSSDVSSFYALKTSLPVVPSVAGFANSSDVSSANATFATSLGAAAAYQAKGSYPLSADVSSFYALKTSLPSVAGFANSSDVSSGWGTIAKSVDVGSTYAHYMGGMDVWSLAAPASRTIANSIEWSFCVTSTTITSAFLVMPQSPFDGQETGFSTVGAITFMTHTLATGVTQTLYNKLTAAAAGLAAQWKWNVSSKAWFRIR